jgi:hypothetical protein
MQEFQFTDKSITLVQATMKNRQCQVKIQADLSDPLLTISGLRQGDSLACLQFSIALEKVIRDARIQTRGTIFYKSIKLLAYADDTDITGRFEHDIKKTFTALKTAEEDDMGLRVNQEKPNTWLRTVKVIHHIYILVIIILKE